MKSVHHDTQNRTADALPNLVLTASGPGELTGWVKPILKEIRFRNKPWRVSLLLWKTAFSSGPEQKIQSLLPELDGILTLPGNLKGLLTNQKNLRFGGAGPTKALLHLGGEPLFSKWLGLRMKCPTFLYWEHAPSWRTYGFKKVFLSEKSSVIFERRAETPESRYQAVGNLFVDAVSLERPQLNPNERNKQGKTVTIGLFPGSRPYQIQCTGPLFRFLIHRITREIPRVQFLFAKSEYLSMDAFSRFLSGKRGRSSNPLTLLAQQTPGREHQGVEQPSKIPVLPSQEVFARSDLVVLLPGTGTAEAMLQGVPMVVLAPYYRLDKNPSPGVPPVLDALFGMLGSCIKQKILLSVLKRYSFFSHPNIKAGREIVPELRGWIRPGSVLKTILNMAEKPALRAEISADLKALAGPPGAAEKIVQALTPFIEQNE